MNAVTLKDAKRNLEQLVEQVIADAEPTIVVTESGDQVIFLPLDEYNSWKETLYLLSNPANAEHLRRSISEAQAGNVQARDLLDAPVRGHRQAGATQGQPDRVLVSPDHRRASPRLHLDVGRADDHRLPVPLRCKVGRRALRRTLLPNAMARKRLEHR